MVTAAPLSEYLEEIRRQVCSHCVERPPGGPPCAPLGKACGVELHLGELVESIHHVESGLLEPYLERNRREICQHCRYLHSEICPCPMDYLLPLIVEAVETVDARHRERVGVEERPPKPRAEKFHGMDAIREAYRKAAGTWQGCDWPTQFGTAMLDLQGVSASEAEKRAEQAATPEERQAWREASAWLARIEALARRAEQAASLALAAANRGDWTDALEHARRAWACEFASGRVIWRGPPWAWQEFYDLIYAAYREQSNSTDCVRR